MAQYPRDAFAHRYNLDGSVDSICTLCFVTLAKESMESELEKTEEVHACIPMGFSPCSAYLTNSASQYIC